MSADITIGFPSAADVADDVAVLASHLTGIDSITNGNSATVWKTDAVTGERYMLVPEGETATFIVIGSTAIGNGSFAALEADVRLEQVDGVTWTQSGSERFLTIGGTDFTSGPRAITVGGVDYLRQGDAFFGSSWDQETEARRVDFPSIEHRWLHAHGYTRTADGGGIGIFHNGHLMAAGSRDQASTNMQNIGRIVIQSKTYRRVRIYGLKGWTSDFRADPAFVKTANTYTRDWRTAISNVFGPFTITKTGNADWSTAAYATSGIVPRRHRNIVTGDADDVLTFTLRSAFAFSPTNKTTGRVPLRFPMLLLQGGAVAELTVGNATEGNPILLRFNGGSGTSGARPVEIDLGGSFSPLLDDDGDAITYNEDHRYELSLILDDQGSSFFLHDLTENGASVQRLQFGGLSYTGERDVIDDISLEITLGTDYCEFEGVYNPPQLQFHVCSSITSQNITVGVVVMATGNHLTRWGDINYSPDYINDPARTLDTALPFGRSGRAITTLSAEMGGLEKIAPRLRGMMIGYLEWSANNSYDQDTIVPVMRDHFKILANNSVDAFLHLPPPMDDSVAGRQDRIRQLNAKVLAEFRSACRRYNTFFIANTDEAYDNAAAAALSSDNTHPTGNTEGAEIVNEMLSRKRPISKAYKSSPRTIRQPTRGRI